MLSAATELRNAEIGRTGATVKDRLQIVDAGRRFFTDADPKSNSIRTFPGISYVGHEKSEQVGPFDLTSIGSFYTAAGEKIHGINVCKFSVPSDLATSTAQSFGFYGTTQSSSSYDLHQYRDLHNLSDQQWARFAFHLNALPGWSITPNGEPEISREKLIEAAASTADIVPEFYFDKRRKVLFVRANHAVAAITPMSGPEKFTFTYLGDDRTFDGKILSRYPGLSELIRERDAGGSATATREGELLKVTSSEGKLLCSERVTAHKLVDDEIYFARVGGTTIYSSPVGELKGISTKYEKTPARLDGEIRGIEVDPNRNFIITAVVRNGPITLEVIDRVTGEVCGSIEGASEKFSIGKNGDISYIDASGAPRLAQTNFLEFKEGEPNELRAARLRDLGHVNGKLDNLDALIIPRLSPENGDYTTESGLEKNARNRLIGYFGPKIEQAVTIQELSKLEESVDQLKAQPEFSRHLSLFEGVDTALQKKKDIVRISGFDGSLKLLADSLSEYDTPLEGVRLRREFAKLEEERRQLLVMDADVRSDLDKRLSTLRTEVQRQIGSIGSALVQEIGEQFGAIQKMLKEVGSAPEVLLVASSQHAADFRELLELFESPKERENWEEKFDNAVQGRRNEILLAQETHKASLRAQSSQQIQECRELLGEVEELFKEASARGQLEMLSDTNPLVKRLRERAEDLPEREGRVFTERIAEIMLARREALSAPAPAPVQVTASKEERFATFMNETFPVFSAPDLCWKAEVIPASSDADHGTLVFWSNFGQEYKPQIGNVPIDLHDPETAKAITDHDGKAGKFFALQKRQVPQIKSSWVVTDYHLQYLDEIADLCKQQLDHQRHLLMLEGESGTGKNILWSVFANKTGRELFRFPCNAQMEKEDMTATKQFSQEKGTHKLLSELVRKIQTPGMIVLFDEFNALPTGTAKILNSLFDEDRSIIVDGKVYKAHPSVILAGAMNPKGYAGTKSLSTELKGRARFLSIEYPPEKTKDGKFASYEAEMLAKQLPEFKPLTSTEFRALWDHLINGDTLANGDAYNTPERETSIKKLRQIVQTAAKLREAYSKYQLRETSEVVNVPFSIREAVDVAACMNKPRFPTVKDAIKNVFVPKGEDALEKANIEKVILSS